MKNRIFKKWLLALTAVIMLSQALSICAASATGDSIPKGEFSSLADLKNSRIGIPTGSSFGDMVQQKLPDAKTSWYNNQTDLLIALDTDKIDAFPADEPVMRYIMGENDMLTYVPEYLDTFEFAYGFPKNQKGQALCEQFNEYLVKLRDDGTLLTMEEKWFGSDESQKEIPDISALPGTNGKLVMASDATYMPFEYVRGDEIVGYDVDIAIGFCEEYGYGLEIKNMSLDAVLPAVQSGKCDFAGSGLTITPERAESVLFSDPNYSGGVVLGVRKDASEMAGGAGFFEGIKSSFEKTFIRESRYKLFIEGIVNTLLITVLSVIFGTALGFAVYMMCRKNNPVARAITGFCLWLVQGMPMVVLLMILYYIVFASFAISGVAVAVIGFTLTFGAAVFGMLETGVGAISHGQYEAAWALGFTENRTFFKIILPQALPLVMPSYKSQIVDLTKATAIVGYIAVQDLTKMGDIVRSRTYEAFFPLIAVTVIYFVLEALIGIFVSKIEVNIDTKSRKKENILKGVSINDKD
ncbi:MAG: transporter substrate-binding domain-containing protein [Lachnospiraceae bacterium]|nr:transporter substrate-binding domain-containing protein [Lachnospiraceae bacterium]